MDQAKIEEVIGFLKQSLINYGIHVDSIALFGSALNGDLDQESDIDLIIISSDFIDLDLFERARLTMKPETDTMRRYKIPMDILNLSPEEYNESFLKQSRQSKIVA